MFTKHYARMVSRDELTDEDVIVYFDIVQSVVATKIVSAYDEEGDKVNVEVLTYTDEDDDGPLYIYEIILDEEIDEEEGDTISEILFTEFDDILFTFEASIEI
jgi:hypothetical protein